MRLMIVVVLGLLFSTHAADTKLNLRIGNAEQIRIEKGLSAYVDQMKSLLQGTGWNSAQRKTVLTQIAWRLAGHPRRTDEFAKVVRQMPGQSAPWFLVFQLGSYQEHWQILRTAKKLNRELRKTDLQFPDKLAEEALNSWLLSEAKYPASLAALQVLMAREYSTLYFLRDLDRTLTREATYHRSAKANENAELLLRVRDRLRSAYLLQSRNVVPRLFALRLNGKDKEHEQLLKQLEACPYLTDGVKLATLTREVDGDELWTKLIAPMLESELTVLKAPPKFNRSRMKKLRVQVSADRVKDQVFENNVQVKLGSIAMTCDSLKVENGVLSASGNVTIKGIKRCSVARAESARIVVRQLLFELTDCVLVVQKKSHHYRSCSLFSTGAIRQSRSLFDEFSEAKDVVKRLSLLKEIESKYEDGELTSEAAYLLALRTLKPHLTWHLPVARRSEMGEQAIRAEVLQDNESSMWDEAHRGEKWMWSDRAEELQKRWEARQAGRKVIHELDPFWRLKALDHDDLRRAKRLLKQSKTTKARSWLSALDRNNTTLTFDVPPAIRTGGFVSMDVRNADKVSFSLHRVKNPRTLADVCSRIGTDFVFRQVTPLRSEQNMLEVAEMLRWQETFAAIKLTEPVATWTTDIAETAYTGVMHDDYAFEEVTASDNEADYFQDGCEQFRRRLDREYGHEGESSWQLNCRIDLPKKTKLLDGAYVLVAQANGQKAYTPLLVNPLDMMMGRNRDGVLVCVTDKGKAIEGATIAASGDMLNTPATNRDGVTFARVFAHGAVALVAGHKGRYAIGGFGRPYWAIYVSRDRGVQRLMEKRAVLLEAQDAQVYKDQLFALAYTDRPVYRPGQRVQFKAIIRKLLQSPKPSPGGRGFRDGDFEFRKRLDLVRAGTVLRYRVVDPKGRELASGEGKLTDFGTFSGEFSLNDASRVGNYSIIISGIGNPRTVPNVFIVSYYRRPNFELSIKAPGSKQPSEDMVVQVAAKYYFGKVVAEADVQISTRNMTTGKHKLHEGETDATGHATVQVATPKEEGDYLLQVTVTDSSGRAVTETHRLQVQSPQTAVHQSDLAAVPTFYQTGKKLVIPCGSAVTVSGPKATYTAKPTDRKVQLQFPAPGWYTCTIGKAQARLFAFASSGKAPKKGDHWVPLHTETNWHLGDKILAMFSRRTVAVGHKLPVLLYLPGHSIGDRILLTMEAESMIDYHVLELKKKGEFHEVLLPIRKRLLPNFYLQACSISSRLQEEQKEAQEQEELQQLREDDGLTDPVKIRVNVHDHNAKEDSGELLVSVQAEKPVYQPGERVTVNCQTTDLSGKPVDAELSLATVDASALAFGVGREQYLPAAMRTRRSPRRFREKSWRRSHAVQAIQQAEMQQAEQAMDRLKEAAKEMAEQAVQDTARQSATVPLSSLGELPIASIPIGRLRKDFRETAAWFPHLRTGPDGKAQTSFTLPDSLTKYKVTAVGITKDSRIGVGTATFQTTLPISAQLILPRFAVEGDEIAINALIHNTTGTDQSAQVTIKLDSDLKIAPQQGWQILGNRAIRQMLIPAAASQSAMLMVRTPAVGNPEIRLDVQTPAGADAEARRLPVHVRGINRIIAKAGGFTGRKDIEIPEGFVVRNANVSVRTNGKFHASEALTELHALIQYPYGCVEQTMSRFLPGVAISRALKQNVLTLPKDIQVKLPRVIEKGLARLYSFQHADGGWGWWKNDKTNHRMTVYVLHGLTLCKNAGVKIDEEVYARGIQFLKHELESNSLRGPGFIHSSSAGDANTLAARGWWVLARSGQADKKKLSAYLTPFSKRKTNEHTLAYCTLAAKAAGLDNLAEGLFKQNTTWQPTSATGLSLKLRLQMIFKANLVDATTTAQDLARLRGAYGWGSTRQTAMAIESLALIVPYIPPVPENAKNKLIVQWGKETLIDLAAKQASRSVHLSSHQIPTGSTISFKQTKHMSGKYKLTLKGVQRGNIKATGTNVRVTRTYSRVNGDKAPSAWRHGNVIRVKLTLKLAVPTEFFMIEDRRPALCEFADEILSGSLADKTAHVEFRDDRLCLFFNRLEPGTHTVTYYLRAETKGKTTVLPCHAFPMYRESQAGSTAADTMAIK